MQTTIVPRYQDLGRGAIEQTLPYSSDPSAALVAIDPRNGFIRAMASSGSYGESQYDLAAQGHRQPGSTFKMFVLTTALKQGIDPYHTYYTSKPLSLDLPQWGHWDVHTADEGYMGTVNLQQATVASDNTVFAQLDLDVGPGAVAATANSMGVTTKLDGIPAEGLGGLRIGVSPLEMADSFATLASGGIHRNPIAIRKVELPGGRVDRPEKAEPRRVLPANVAYEVTRILHDNITSGTGTAAYTGCSGQAGKTGTTDNYVDAWFDGYQPNLATAVWVGYPQSNDIAMTSVHGITVFGGTFPADIWNAFYSSIGVPCADFQVPSQAIRWAPFTGSYTASAPSPRKPSKEAQGTSGSAAAARRLRLRRLRARRRDPATRAGPEPGSRSPAATGGPGPARARPAGSGRNRGRYLSAERRRSIGVAGLAGLLICAVPLAAPGTALVPSALDGGPGWLLGPYGSGTGIGPGPYLAIIWIAFAAYLCVIAGAPALPGRLLWSVIAILVAAFALAPPLLSQDVFSYISYARLGAEHGLNPYLHVPAERPADPAFAHLGWPDSVSAYGPLFTILAHPLGSVGVPVALWALKAVSALSVLGVAALSARLAAIRGLDPRFGAALIALNPLVLVHVVGGAHNEGLMMLLAMAGVSAVLALREGSGAAAILASSAIKVSALFVAPFALIGAARRRRFLLGAALGALAIAAASIAAFGPHALDAIGLAGENQAAREPPQPPPPRLAAHRRRRSAMRAQAPWSSTGSPSPGCCAGPGAAPTGSGRPAGPASACCSPAAGSCPGTSSGPFPWPRSPGTAFCSAACWPSLPCTWRPGSRSSGASAGGPRRLPDAAVRLGLAAAEEGDGADVDQLDESQGGPQRDRDHGPNGEAAAGERDLDRPGEGRVPHPEPGRSDQGDCRRDYAEGLSRTDHEHLLRRDVVHGAGGEVDPERGHHPVEGVEGQHRDHAAQRQQLRKRVAAEGTQEAGREGPNTRGLRTTTAAGTTRSTAQRSGWPWRSGWTIRK